MIVALHVEQRILNQDGVVELRMLRERDAHQQTAVAAAADPQMLRARDAVSDQLLRDRGEVVVDALPVLLKSRPVPLRSELAAAANIAEDVDPAALEPGCPGVAVVARRI